MVGNNTHRPLDPKEFRGFALADEHAPLIFLNGKDFLAAQIFTLVHELAHLWLGQSAVTDADTLRAPEEPIERYCNEIAAEVLVPEQEFVARWRTGDETRAQIQRLTHVFKVSTLVLLYRAHNLHLISLAQMEAIHRDEVRLVATNESDLPALQQAYRAHLREAFMKRPTCTAMTR